MPKPAVVLANVGTSIINNRKYSVEGPQRQALETAIDELHDELGDDGPKAMEQTGHRAPGAEFVGEFADWALDHGPEASAELKSMAEIRADLERDGHRLSHIHLLASDTIDGMLAARIVGQALQTWDWDDYLRVDIHRIGGLQVKNATDFARYGLAEYVETVYGLLETHPASSFRRIFNPTGGFKSVVPYLTLIAMLEDAETRYIYERSDDMLELRPLPVTFDTKVVSRALPLLEQTQNASSLSRQTLQDGLDLQDPLRHTPFASLWTEWDDGEFILSGLGKILLRRHRSSSDRVLLSRQARRDLEDLSASQRRLVEKGLRRLRSPGHRRSGAHEKYGTDKSDCWCLGDSGSHYRIFFKPRQTDAGDTEVHVIRAFALTDHDQKDRIIDTSGIFSKDAGGFEPLEDHLHFG